jgi:hypothetical protein
VEYPDRHQSSILCERHVNNIARIIDLYLRKWNSRWNTLTDANRQFSVKEMLITLQELLICTYAALVQSSSFFSCPFVLSRASLVCLEFIARPIPARGNGACL